MHLEEDYDKNKRVLKDFALMFDVRDIYSPNKFHQQKGRFSFQFEDMKMSNGKPNYQRVLFFYADDTEVKAMKDYFNGAEKIYDKSKNIEVVAFLNEKKEPEGFTKIYDFNKNCYYFANIKDGLIEGFVAKFSISDNEYAFEDAYIFYKGNKTKILSGYIDKLREYKKKYKITTISWS